MKFGQVEDASHIDFSLPTDHPQTLESLSKNSFGLEDIRVGCARWSKNDLKGLYPRGTKDELPYYSQQFNSIELNATFFGMPSSEKITTWKNKTASDFKFFPKLTNSISHYRRLISVDDLVTQFVMSVMHFDEKLGMLFLQLHDNFPPKDYYRLEEFVKKWPQEIPLAIELRNAAWFEDIQALDKVCYLFAEYNITHVIVDTPGRRDVLHMRLTTPQVFVRFVSTNTEVDFNRLDEWVERLTFWKEKGLHNLYFFVHQKIEPTSLLRAAYFIEKINTQWDKNLPIPRMANYQHPTLF